MPLCGLLRLAAASLASSAICNHMENGMTDLPHKLIISKRGKRGFELEPEVLNTRSDILDFLRTRRSVVSPEIVPPGPDEAMLARIMEAACRVPDHGKLTPWRFILFRAEDCKRFADFLRRRWQALTEDGKELLERPILVTQQAPLIVTVISRVMDHPKIPHWEQRLSAGAACHNLLLAAQAAGYAAHWRTGWPAYDEEVLRHLGVDTAAGERVAGFIHIGTRRDDAPPLTDRRRPFWQDLAMTYEEVCGATGEDSESLDGDEA